jgi:hypothetical protein
MTWLFHFIKCALVESRDYRRVILSDKGSVGGGEIEWLGEANEANPVASYSVHSVEALPPTGNKPIGFPRKKGHHHSQVKDILAHPVRC